MITPEFPNDVFAEFAAINVVFDSVSASIPVFQQRPSGQQQTFPRVQRTITGIQRWGRLLRLPWFWR